MIHFLDILETLSILVACADDRKVLDAIIPVNASGPPQLGKPLHQLARMGRASSFSTPFVVSFIVLTLSTIFRYAAMRWLGRHFTFQLSVKSLSQGKQNSGIPWPSSTNMDTSSKH